MRYSGLSSQNLCRDFLRAFAAVHEEKNGHAHGETVGDLFQNDGAPAIGNFAVNFHAAIDRTRMHDQRIGFGFFQALFVQAKQTRVFAQTGKHALALPFVLDAQQIDDIGIGDRFIDVVGDAAAHLLEDFRDEGGWAAQRDVGTEFRQRPDIGTGDATVEDVAENRDVQSGDFPLLFQNGEGIQQRLRGMLVGAVAGVDDPGPRSRRGAGRRCPSSARRTRRTGSS